MAKALEELASSGNIGRAKIILAEVYWRSKAWMPTMGWTGRLMTGLLEEAVGLFQSALLLRAFDATWIGAGVVPGLNHEQIRESKYQRQGSEDDECSARA